MSQSVVPAQVPYTDTHVGRPALEQVLSAVDSYTYLYYEEEAPRCARGMRLFRYMYFYVFQVMVA